MIILICLQDRLFGPEVDKLLYFLIAETSSSFEKEAYSITFLLGISVRRLILTWQL